MLEATCHCGRVKVEVPEAPTVLIECNCSLCRRLGGQWAYYAFGKLRFTGHPEDTTQYVWGDRTLRTMRCRHCGCVTHWEALNPDASSRSGVNANNFPPEVTAPIKVRHFDGATTWKMLD